VIRVDSRSFLNMVGMAQEIPAFFRADGVSDALIAVWCTFGARRSSDIRFLSVSSQDGGSAMNVRYRVDLNQDERDQLGTMLSGGKHAVRRLKRAQILLAADAGETDEAIAANVCVGLSTVYRTKRRFVEGNLELIRD
jgi:Homeodomain-like domain